MKRDRTTSRPCTLAFFFSFLSYFWFYQENFVLGHISYYVADPLREDIKMFLIYPEREHNRLTVTGKKNYSEGAL